MTAWHHLIERTEHVCPAGRNPVRLANLAVAAQMSAQSRRGRRSRALDGAALADAVHELAVEPLVCATDDILTWTALATDAAAAAREFSAPGGMDAWVQSFQGADPQRKTRGAYATPQRLAVPMARLLLRGGAVPDRVVDPSAGAGGLLVAVLRELLRRDKSSGVVEHVRRLHGVELDPVARELSCLTVWLAAGGEVPVSEIATRVIVGNAITRDWWADELFAALIMNPPWDSLRPQRGASPALDAEPEATLARLADEADGAPGLPPLFTAQGRGDRNLYKAFVELAPHLLLPRARLVGLVPGGWSSDLGTVALRRAYLDQLRLEQWTSFENLRGYFPIDARYKFGVIAGRRDDAGTQAFSVRGFAVDAQDLRRRHIRVKASDVPKIGGAAGIVPDLTSRAELRLMIQFRRAGAPFFAPSGPVGTVLYDREVDLTLDRKSGRFVRLEDAAATAMPDGSWRARDGRELVPLLEGRMVGQYEFHEKSWVAGSGRTAEWTYANGHPLAACQPQFLIEPASESRYRIAMCDVTSATNTRTVLATWVPPRWRCGNTAPVLVFESERHALAAVAILNSMVFDWQARRLVAGLHLNRFYLDALAWPQVDEQQLGDLASAAAGLQRMSPRYTGLGRDPLATPGMSNDYAQTQALIERIVAEGFNLSQAMLQAVYSPDRDDRRGFWRHYASDPHAEAIVEKVLTEPLAVR